MEMWKAVLEYEGLYEVSDLGRVRRIAPGQGTRTGIRRPQMTTTGYHSLMLSKGGKVSGVRVHRVVVEAFIGPIPAGLCVNHRDGDKLNNRLDNLEIATYLENSHHARDVLGWRPVTRYGEAVGTAKLTEENVRYIRSHQKAYGIATRLANELGVDQSVVGKIFSRRLWAHVK